MIRICFLEPDANNKPAPSAAREPAINSRVDKIVLTSVIAFRIMLQQPICQIRLIFGTSKNVRMRSVLQFAAWFRSGCDDDRLSTDRQVSKCRL